MTRFVRIEFDTNLHAMPWKFRALEISTDVHPGAVTQVMFEVVNTSDRPVTGQAIPSYGPRNAAQYFRKLDCFCFARQTLAPGETRRMLTVMLVRAFRGHFDAEHHFGFEAAAWYWHFVDVVWLLLFVLVYWL